MINGGSMNLTRRKMLRLIGAAAVLLAEGCRPGSSGPAWWRRLWRRKPASASVPPCIVRPEQMEGPYFVDERLRRSDIRSDPSDGSIKEGLPLRMALRIHQIRGSACTPLAGAAVDLWQCDALGVYGDVQDRSFDTRGKKFLRGCQTTDAAGTVRFVTIFPGWYPGRTVHIHFKIRTDPEARFGYEFTSQLYFDDAVTDQVLAQAPYNIPGRRTRNSQDRIFAEGGDQLILPLTRGEDGYSGTFDIGLEVT